MPRESDYLGRTLGHLTADFRLKRGFETKAQAKRWVADRRGPIRVGKLDIYRCRICPNWHVGSKPKPQC